MDEWVEAWQAAERVAFGMHPAARDPEADRYGKRGPIERLEARVAELVGHEAAMWLPSGTMAQQIALRIHAEHTGRRAVAFHPYCHLDVHEERAYEVLHGLHGVHLGRRERLIEPADVDGLHEPAAALLLELPQRDLGGRLPEWDALVATCDAARARGAALHLDGARLWQCGPFYGRPLAEIGGLFDSVYVSFYKDVGAPSGCALAGSAELIDEARVWQIRHGGRLFSVLPLVRAAEAGLDEVLPRMPELVDRAQAAAASLAGIEGLTVTPSPPHTAMFHLLARRPLTELNDGILELTRETRTWLGGEFNATDDPGTQRTELTVTVASLDTPVEEITALWAELLRRVGPAGA